MGHPIDNAEFRSDSAFSASRLARLVGWGALTLVISGIVALIVVFVRSAAPTGSEVGDAIAATRQLIEVQNEPLQPLPLHLGLDPRKVEFGRELFADARLSGDGTIACSSCHLPQHGGADNARSSKGIGGRLTAVNTPTIRNSQFSVAQFWDGRAANLEAQVDGPLQNPGEMGATWPAVMDRLKSDAGYVAAARSIYDGPLTAAIVRDAIAEYERSQLSLGSRFDAFLRGDRGALSEAERTGYRLFKNYGCATCHQGVAVGGNMFQRMGLFADYFSDRGLPETPADLGRYNVTSAETDRHVFKVPSLRDVALTAPYFHDGSAATLEEAIAVMARYQLGQEMPSADMELIVGFLRTLTSEPPGNSP
jgi:cytochrome c peroxidase